MNEGSAITRHAAQREHDADERGTISLCEHCGNVPSDYYIDHDIGSICIECLIEMFGPRLVKFAGGKADGAYEMDTRTGPDGSFVYFLVSWDRGSSSFEARIPLADVKNMGVE